MKIKKRFWKPFFEILFLLAVVAFAIYLASLAQESGFVKKFILDYGYVGISLLSIISGLNIIVPIPIIAFFPLFIAAGLNQWLVILIVVIGITIADGISYIVGDIGRNVISERVKKKMKHLERLRDQYYWLPLVVLFLFASFVPFPNEVLVIPMAFLGYRLIHMLPLLLVGNAVFNILVMLSIVNFL